MTKESGYDNLLNKISSKKSYIVVGVDPDLEHIPQKFLRTKKKFSNLSEKKVSKIFFDFGKEVIDIISDNTVGVKLQSAFFERYRWEGLKTFFKLAEYAHRKNLFTIADVKRTDIPNTAKQYFFSYLKNSHFDSMTVVPFFGYDTIETFIKLADDFNKLIFVVLVPTNDGGEKLQCLKTNKGMLFEIIATMLKGISKKIGIVCKSDKEVLKKVRTILPYSIILIPGIGAQKGSIEPIKYAFNKKLFWRSGVIVNVSRSVIYPQKFGVVKTFKNWSDGVLENLLHYKNSLNNLQK